MRLPPGTALHVSMRFAPDHIVKVGRLALDRGVALLEYDRALVDARLELNPLLGPPPGGLVAARAPRIFEGLHGVFADSLPDAWGRALMRRRATARGIAYGDLSPLERLAWIGSSGMGALVYEPDFADRSRDEVVDLDALADEAASVVEGGATAVVDQLVRIGAASGGTRPKVLVGMNESGDLTTARDRFGFVPWIVKFRDRGDASDAGALEVAFADMARAAGVDVMPTRLIPERAGGGFFATQRFDRDGERRIHAPSLAGLLDVDWSVPAGDYDIAMRVVQRVVGRAGAVQSMFRRAAFNALAVNRDDHWKQHALRVDRTGTWTLAPAYDLTFSRGPSNQHYLTINGAGRDITRADLAKLAAEYGIKAARTTEILDEVRTAVGAFRRYAVAYDVSAATIREVEREHAAADAAFRGTPTAR